MPSNKELSRLFNVFSELLLLHEKDERLAVLLSGAAYRLRRIEEPVAEMEKKELSDLFRPQVSAPILALKNTDTIADLDELIQLTPPGLFEMMRIKGLGGKKLAILWKTAGIDTIDQLLKCAKAGELRKIPGFGAKTEQNIIQSIENYFSQQDRFHYATVADAADALVKFLQKVFKTKLISLCGEIRREFLTVDGIDIIASGIEKKMGEPLLRKHLVIESTKNQLTKAHTLDEIPVLIHHVRKEDFYFELFRLTGNEEHVEKVTERLNMKKNSRSAKALKYESEQHIYKSAGLPYILPEMREDVVEWNFKGAAGELVKLEDIKGVVHNHTTYSDGVDSLEDFSNACRKRGYEYVVISDHSKNAHYAGGLKEEKLVKQMSEIDKVNKKMKGFRILKSVECDILVSGELDYDETILKQLDLVIVSIHQLLKMDEEKATRRLIRAIENPYTDILGHMTGRQLLIRPGYPVNFKKVIDACAANQVVIEINANPYRLDMDWSHIPYAMEKGVMISINPDAHSIGEIDNIRWGVSAARKGGLTKEMCWNARGREEIQEIINR